MSNYRRDKLGLQEPIVPAQAPAAVTTSDIDGYYVCEGRGYRGTMAIRSMENDNFALQGILSGTLWVGVGLRAGSALAASFEFPTPMTGIYELDGTTSFTGKLTTFTAGGPVATETWTFSHGLDEWEVGDAILGNWSFDEFWYPGTIREKSMEGTIVRYLVRFADGDEEWLGASRIMPEKLTSGDLVYQTCGLFHPNGKGQPAAGGLSQQPPERLALQRLAKPCRILHREGDVLHLESPDRRRDTTDLEFIRTIYPRERSLSMPDEIMQQ